MEGELHSGCPAGKDRNQSKHMDGHHGFKPRHYMNVSAMASPEPPRGTEFKDVHRKFRLSHGDAGDDTCHVQFTIGILTSRSQRRRQHVNVS
jgi:hypothetical protein